MNEKEIKELELNNEIIANALALQLIDEKEFTKILYSSWINNDDIVNIIVEIKKFTMKFKNELQKRFD